MNRELEDIFRVGLESTGSSPSPQTWSKIKKRLWWNEIVATLSTGTVQPSASVWGSIALSLWLKNFLRYNITTFNVYYLGLAVTIITSAIIFSGDNNSNALLAVNSDQPFSQNYVLDVSANESANNEISSQIQAENISAASKKVSTNINLPLNTGQPENLTNNQTNSFVQQTTNNPELLKESTETKSLVSTNNRIQLKQLALISPVLNNISPDINLTIYDSIKDWTGKPVTLEKYKLSADLFASYSVASGKYSSNSMSSDFLGDHGFRFGPQISGGIALNYLYKNFCFQGGVSYTELGQSSEFQTLHYRTDTTLINILFDGGYFSYDTLWVLNLDSLINGNPVYVAVIDSHYVHTIDTVSIEKPVTTKQIEDNKAYARLSYIEAPLSVGYTLSSGKLDYRLKLSFIPGLLTYTSGDMVNPFAEFGDLNVSRQTDRQWMFSGGTSLEIVYNPLPRIGISLEPMYRCNFNSLFSDEMPFNIKTSSWGCKLSLRYYIK